MDQPAIAAASHRRLNATPLSIEARPLLRLLQVGGRAQVVSVGVDGDGALSVGTEELQGKGLQTPDHFGVGMAERIVLAGRDNGNDRIHLIQKV